MRTYDDPLMKQTFLNTAVSPFKIFEFVGTPWLLYMYCCHQFCTRSDRRCSWSSWHCFCVFVSGSFQLAMPTNSQRRRISEANTVVRSVERDELSRRYRLPPLYSSFSGHSVNTRLFLDNTITYVLLGTKRYNGLKIKTMIAGGTAEGYVGLGCCSSF